MSVLSVAVSILSVAVIALGVAVHLILQRLQNAEDCLEARFDEHGYFVYPGKVRFERSTMYDLDKLSEQYNATRVQVNNHYESAAEPRNPPRQSTGD